MQLTFIDLFAGVGGFRRGMELAGHKCVGFCEWDRFATMSYTSMHLATDEQRQYLHSLPFKDRQKEIIKEEYRNGEWYASDIRTLDANSMPRADVWTFGAPCQDFSIAGERKGLDGDRSSLVREVFRILREIEEKDRPKQLIYENVKGMFSSNKGFDFLEILLAMDELGYDIEWQLFNSKNFEVPQNRERVYVIGHLRGRGGRKIFPIGGEDSPINTKQREIIKLFDIPKEIINDNKRQRRVYSTEGIGPTLLGRQDSPKILKIGNINPGNTGQSGNVYSSSGISPTLDTCQGGNRMPKIAIPVLTPDRIHKRQNGRRFKENGEDMFTLTAQDRHGVMVREATKQGFAVAELGDSINLEQPNSKTRRGRVGKKVAQTLTTGCNQGVLASGLYLHDSSRFHKKPLLGLSRCLKAEKHDAGVYDGCRIRKLTPKECFRLQGWEDKYFYRAAMVNSDSQLYKQAGNGVTVTVVHAIAERLGGTN